MSTNPTITAAAIAARSGRNLPGAAFFTTHYVGQWGKLVPENHTNQEDAIDYVAWLIRSGRKYRGTQIVDPVMGGTWLDFTEAALALIAEEDETDCIEALGDAVLSDQAAAEAAAGVR